MFENQVILVTGITGSFGHKFAEFVLRDHHPKKLIGYSRDELKQFEMKRRYPDIYYIVGDVRDVRALNRAMEGVDVVFHAAALKQIQSCRDNPREAVMTNCLGTLNVIDAAMDRGVKKLLALSTDKSTDACTLYGATKLALEGLVIGHNGKTRMSCVRYGNVIGSRGSVIPKWREQAKSGKITITHPDMSRFLITLDQAVEFVLTSCDLMRGGEIFIPKIPSVRILDLAEAVAPNCEHEYIGLQAGEKLYESLISQHESYRTVDLGDRYVILPDPWYAKYYRGAMVPAGWCYSSNANNQWLETQDVLGLIGD